MFPNSMYTSASQQCSPIAPMNLAVNLKEPWKTVLNEEFEKPYFKELESLLTPKYLAGTVCPPVELIFNAFNLTPFDRVKVVILGQDPYPGDGQAMGLSFSVPNGISIPPSLNTIYKEQDRDPKIEFVRPNHGNLEYWASQGVLLLNTVLTVETQDPNPDVKKGWQTFTDRVIELISKRPSGVVFMLCGEFAHKKAHLIDRSKHSIIMTSHPSPMGGLNVKHMVPFFGSNCFSVCNDYLSQLGHLPIDWNLPTY